MRGYTAQDFAAYVANLNKRIFYGVRVTVAHCESIPDPIQGSSVLWYTMDVEVPARSDNAARHRIGSSIATATVQVLRAQFGYINVHDPMVHRRDKLPGSKANYIFSIRVRHAPL